MWKGGSEQQLVTPCPVDPVDPLDPLRVPKNGFTIQPAQPCSATVPFLCRWAQEEDPKVEEKRCQNHLKTTSGGVWRGPGTPPGPQVRIMSKKGNDSHDSLTYFGVVFVFSQNGDI